MPLYNGVLRVVSVTVCGMGLTYLQAVSCLDCGGGGVDWGVPNGGGGARLRRSRYVWRLNLYLMQTID